VSTLLHIDTAIQLGSICISNDDKSLGVKINSSQNDHAAWLQPAIHSLLQEHDIELKNLDAIAVSAGPGSYTGLRVSMATAKGLCYVLQKPLILVGTLKMMAVSALEIEADFFCPMIDARRMEVFTAVYDHHLNELVKPHNCILPDCNFLNLLDEGRVVFFGNGSSKFEPLVSHQNAIFKELETTAEQMVGLAYQSMKKNEFADLAYSEPLYGKEFFSPALRKLVDI
jgi:tRNA threonylcarbamoyladenosine biosynthesis protein TsaB